MSLCPFGRRPSDLSSEILTDDRKRWFAQKFLNKLDTKASLALKYNLKPHTLQIGRIMLEKEFLSLTLRVRSPLWDSDRSWLIEKLMYNSTTTYTLSGSVVRWLFTR